MMGFLSIKNKILVFGTVCFFVACFSNVNIPLNNLPSKNPPDPDSLQSSSSSQILAPLLLFGFELELKSSSFHFGRGGGV